MDDLLEALMKLGGGLLVFFGVTKAVQYPLAKRVEALEKAPPKREVVECSRLMSSCPVATKQESHEKEIAGLGRWMERIEEKLDRVIERI